MRKYVYSNFVYLVTVLLLLMIPSGASALVYTMDFDSGGTYNRPAWYEEDNFRVVPIDTYDGYNHFDVRASPDRYLGLHYNNNASTVEFDHFDLGFDLVSFDIESNDGVATMISSSGVVTDLTGLTGTVFFDSLDWWNLTSFTISTEGNLNLDNLIFENTPTVVPEPGTILLLGAGLAGLIGFTSIRKRKK